MPQNRKKSLSQQGGITMYVVIRNKATDEIVKVFDMNKTLDYSYSSNCYSEEVEECPSLPSHP